MARTLDAADIAAIELGLNVPRETDAVAPTTERQGPWWGSSSELKLAELLGSATLFTASGIRFTRGKSMKKFWWILTGMGVAAAIAYLVNNSPSYQ